MELRLHSSDEVISFARAGGCRNGINAIQAIGEYYSDICPVPQQSKYVELQRCK